MVSKKNTGIAAILSHLPDRPGVYQYLDRDGRIIYIGKAKNLKKRVSSYFTKGLVGKTLAMVNRIVDIQYFVVESEQDALLLENNLIKKHQPKYNIQLRDDKTFPWICIKNEAFPRIFLTRNRVNDGSEYFGPYSSMVTVRTLLEMIRKIYPIRTCNYNLDPGMIKSRKYKVCLEYHLGNCKGPCEGFQEQKEYNESIDQIREILQGNIQQVIRMIDKYMKRYAADFQFEKADLFKQKIEVLRKFQAKSTIVSPSVRHVDVFSVASDENRACVNFLKVIQGAVVQTHSVEMKKKLEEKDEEILSNAILDIRERLGSDARETLVPFTPEFAIPGTRFRVPERGDMKRLLDLSLRNAKYMLIERKKLSETGSRGQRAMRILSALQKDLNLKVLPVHIEAFDNSNIQGSFPVSACVVFRNGRASKKEYRHFNVRSVKGPDDFASMEEIVFRRYHRLVRENQSLPQLIIIDGGKGQLNAALKSLDKLGLKKGTAIMGIAKKLEEIYFPGDKLPLYLDKQSESLKLIQQIRNEAHRFGLEFHRHKRKSEIGRSELESIRGIGSSTAKLLLKSFGSVSKIKKLEEEELAKVIGRAKARLIGDYFRVQPE